MKRKNIFILEDNHLIRTIIKRILVKSGFESLHIFACGQDTLRYSISTKPELIISDINLEQGMNGIETCNKIKIIYPGVKIIFISAETDYKIIEQTKKIQPSFFLTKPIDFSLLLMAAENLLGQENSFEFDNQ